MRTQRFFRWLCLASAILTAVLLSRDAHTQSPAATSNIKTGGGLTVVTFITTPGNIRVNLPDDLRAGDTISGTVLAEPNGRSKEEQTANQAELKKFGIRLIGRASDKPEDVSLGDVSAVFKYALVNDRESGSVFSVGLILNTGSIVTQANIPLTPSGAVVTPDPRMTTPPGKTSSGAVITPDPKIIPTFNVPGLGQAGRPLVIEGPFDGNSSNTSVNFRTENSSGGFELLAESPRKAVFNAPPNVVGAVELQLKEGPTGTTSAFRNLGVQLSAPKTELLRGERTTLTIQVTGLEGIKTPVPLTLTSEGVIAMEGGSYQPLAISPSQVAADGRYTTTRGITGLQTGGWSATATVVTHPFNTCLQDDSNGNLFVFDPKTGDYIFSQPEGGTGAVVLPWIAQTRGATPASTSDMKLVAPVVTSAGCKLDLDHKTSDRQVQVTIDTCAKTGQASVQTGQTKLVIRDRNIADNACFGLRPK